MSNDAGCRVRPLVFTIQAAPSYQISRPQTPVRRHAWTSTGPVICIFTVPDSQPAFDGYLLLDVDLVLRSPYVCSVYS